VAQGQWLELGACDPKALVNARLECHHAVQLLTHVARGYIPAREDDSHTNLGWDHARGALMGREVGMVSPALPFGLQVADLALVCGEQSLALHGRTWDEAADWIRGVLQEHGLSLEPFGKPLHFEIPDHPAAHGAPFDALNEAVALAELARYWANGDLALRGIAGPVRCWPHHFDIGGLMELPAGRSIGFGLEPGDEYYPQPYFYVSLYPNPDPAVLPPLANGGHWHTDRWVGAVATAEEFARGDAAWQEAWVGRFVGGAVGKLKGLAEP